MSSDDAHTPGADTAGSQYTDMRTMWQRELHGDLYDSTSGWYGKALSYWQKVPATVSGVLGGMDHIHDVDIAESRAFITALPQRGMSRALDCGAGIGRITKSLLASMYEEVDVLEPVTHMMEQAKVNLTGLRIGTFMQSSMETAQLPACVYDLIVIQWCAIYLTDSDFVAFFRRCKAALTSTGYIFFKENYFDDDRFLVDKDDSSITRSDAHYKRLFAQAGVTVVCEAPQRKWPRNLIAVKMYALR